MARKSKSMTDKLLAKSMTEIEKTLNSLRRTIESYMPAGKTVARTKAKVRRRIARKPARTTAKRAKARR
jgi:hypothetical protein